MEIPKDAAVLDHRVVEIRAEALLAMDDLDDAIRYLANTLKSLGETT